MTFGVSNSMSAMLARVNSIESNFSALGVEMNVAQNVPQSDFQTILNSKIKEAEKKEE